jgi:hypothetical protein
MRDAARSTRYVTASMEEEAPSARLRKSLNAWSAVACHTPMALSESNELCIISWKPLNYFSIFSNWPTAAYSTTQNYPHCQLTPLSFLLPDAQ